MNPIKIITALTMLLVGWNAAGKEKTEFVVSAPHTVYVGTPFQLAYTVNAAAKDLRAPDFQFFEILAGPFESRSSSWQSINGKTTSSVTLTYTFTLMPQKAGTFKFPPATITVKGEKVYSNGLTIKVDEADAAPASAETRGGGNTGRTSARSSEASARRVTNESVFIRTIASKTNVYEQEAILITYKLYTLLDIAKFGDIRLPDFNGFLKQEIEQSANKQLAAETYNGRSYGTVVLYQTLLFPQRAGEITIDKAIFPAYLHLRNEAQLRSIFDDFFDSYSTVEKNLVAPAVKIQVKNLPTESKPASFSGAVGEFSIQSTISSTTPKTNEAVTIKIVVSGAGNMKLLKNPEIKFPTTFEAYDPKTQDHFNVTAGGVSGTKTIEYLFIPRRTGKYEIPPAELAYFDLKAQRYKTLTTPTYVLNVQKGEGGETVVGNYTHKEETPELAKDIRYIHTGPVELQTEQRHIFGTMPFWMLFLIPLLLLAILIVVLRKQLKERADLALMKTKRANKVAQKRLKTAQKYLAEGNKEPFYQEVMKALSNYLSHKLAIPVANLSKDNIRSSMSAHGLDDTLIDQFIDMLNTCEFASYAPNSGQPEMDNLYDAAVEAIEKVEQQFRTNKTSNA